jgi:hypothetical protein
LCRRFLFALLVFLHEFLNAPSRVDQLLFAREEGVAIRADFDAQVTGGVAHLKGVAARARNCGQDILRMNFRFHDYSPFAFAFYQILNIRQYRCKSKRIFVARWASSEQTVALPINWLRFQD